MKERAVWALWVMAAHVCSMATSTTDDFLMVYDDAAEGVNETQQTCVRPCQALPVHGMLGGRTHCVRLSAPIE